MSPALGLTFLSKLFLTATIAHLALCVQGHNLIPRTLSFGDELDGDLGTGL